jgi:Alw26I/Eco31I/Esp3I family type II restriction endonuclease
MYSAHGDSALVLFVKLFGTPDNVSKSLQSIEDWVGWINTELVARECALLSPGAMSNAPDRFEGFHSFNRCCRGQADTGRNPDNLRQYVTDRRAFEFWSEGNWVAADRMMALVRTKFDSEACADGGDPPPTADHIGPVSLGFKHSPVFRLLSRSANSAKNNRMALADVQYLKELSSSGESVASWFAEPLWQKLMARVENDEHALRLSKILRDHHRVAMSTLCLVYERGHALFLCSLLSLDCADYEYDFENLRIQEFITCYDRITAKPRITKYAVEQKARRIRVGFASLRSYGDKENRHGLNLGKPATEALLSEVDRHLTPLGGDADEVNSRLVEVIQSEGELDEQALRELCTVIENFTSLEQFNRTRSILTDYFTQSADLLSNQWDDERYVRAEGFFT